MRLAGATVAIASLIFTLPLAPQVALGQPCVSGNMTVEISTDPDFPNMYKYTLELHWDLPKQALGHLDIFLQLENCECICDPRFVQFETPAGNAFSTGEDGDCLNDYFGEYICVGDPSIPETMLGPAIKFEPAQAGCKSGTLGDGIMSFFSPMPPGEETVLPEGLVVKNGQDTCPGNIFGVFPQCNCFLDPAPETWGAVKSLYR